MPKKKPKPPDPTLDQVKAELSHGSVVLRVWYKGKHSKSNKGTYPFKGKWDDDEKGWADANSEKERFLAFLGAWKPAARGRRRAANKHPGDPWSGAIAPQ